MSVPIPLLDPLTPDRMGIRSLNLRAANGHEPAQGGGVIPAGQVSITITPGEWAGDTWVRDRPPVTTPDVAAWLGSLAAAADPLTAEAVTRFGRVQSDLLWLLRLRLSADGVCPRPDAEG